MSRRTAAAKRVGASRFALWRRQHAWCCKDSLRQLLHRPLGTGLTILVMGLALALPLAFYLLLVNVQHFATTFGDSQSISVFLKSSIDADEATSLAHTLRRRPDVGSVHLRTPEQGLAELRAMQGFHAAVKLLAHNPLPFVLLIEPRGAAQGTRLETLVRDLRHLPQVALVQDNGRWRARLEALMALARRTAVLLAALLAAAAVLVIGNTVRLNLRARAGEIAIQRLIGDSASFVRRPYLYEGAWYGLAAGIVAALLVLWLEAVLAAPVRDLVASYGGRLQFGGLSWSTLAVTPVIAIVLGWLGSWLASSRHLARPPT
jgi:cell division transport system permease protein